jgi:2-keto-4-pentenoate hydratase/2-oxohepta-3-ene-1,7-dioic acid hydratase in catechol pathway
MYQLFDVLVLTIRLIVSFLRKSLYRLGKPRIRITSDTPQSVLETGRPLPTCPTVFTKPSPAVADHNENIPIPKIAQSQCDYEGELTIVIGKDAKNVTEADALDYVAAYTAGNDVSARDWQREAGKAGPVPQWTFSKSFDKYAPLGPCLVAAHILGEADGLSLKTIVNGEVRQESNTSDLFFGVRKLVAFCSQGQTLQKGSLIMTGTPGGVGLFMKPQGFLEHGDEVVVEIGKIGSLRNVMDFE